MLFRLCRFTILIFCPIERIGPKRKVENSKDKKVLYVFQVRSIASESDRAFNGGPLEQSFYQTSALSEDELVYVNGFDRINGADPKEELQNLVREYSNHLDWFTVDLDGEHSAMDGRILEEHTEYVVQAIHRVRKIQKCSRSTFHLKHHMNKLMN